MVISINKQQRVFLGNDPININDIKALFGRESATRRISRSSFARTRMCPSAATVMDA